MCFLEYPFSKVRAVDHIDQLHLTSLICTEGFLISSTESFVQDAMDLIAGHYTVSRSNPSPFELNTFESLAVVDTSLSPMHLMICHRLS
jgi:hypothetical protein